MFHNYSLQALTCLEISGPTGNYLPKIEESAFHLSFLPTTFSSADSLPLISPSVPLNTDTTSKLLATTSAFSSCLKTSANLVTLADRRAHWVRRIVRDDIYNRQASLVLRMLVLVGLLGLGARIRHSEEGLPFDTLLEDYGWLRLHERGEAS